MENNTLNGIEIKNEEINSLEFRSEEVREILGKIPHWTVRSGAGYLLILILFSLLISSFIKYPDVVKAPIILTTQHPPISLVTKNPGYAIILVKDNQSISIGQTIGYLMSTANIKDVLRLEQRLDSFKSIFYANPFVLNNYSFSDNLKVGEIQDTYNQFQKALTSYRFFTHQRGNTIRTIPIQSEIKSNSDLARQMQGENNIRLNELQLAKKSFERDSILYVEKVISAQEFEQKKKEYLSNIREYQSAVSELTNRQIDKIQLYGRVNDLHLEDQKQNDELLRQIETSMKELDTHIKKWEDLYLITSPVQGKVALFSYWANNQFIKSGEEIASVIPENKEYIIRAKVPVIGSGKIKIGQKVNIKLDSYPYSEYGMLYGTVKEMSLLPKENSYTVLITIPDSLVTSYGRKIDFKQEMTGQAEIITEDLNLLERFFYQFHKLANRS